MASPRTETFSTTEACEIVGLTPRLADSWVRERGIVAPSASEASPGSGTYRRWSQSDLRVLTVLRRLNDLNAPYDVLGPAAKLLMRSPPRARDARWLVASAKGARIVALRELPGTVGDRCWVVRLG